jgi:hypothetical protein
MADGHGVRSDLLGDYLFDACGYLKRSRLIGADEVVELRDRLAPHWQPTRSVAIERIRSLVDVPGLATIGERLAQELALGRYINQPFRLIESYALRRSAGSSQGLHNGFSQRQQSPWGSASRTMWRHHTYHDGKTYCMMVKVLLYLTDVTCTADAPFCLVEGSHKANYALPLSGSDIDAAMAADALPNVRTVSVAAGDVIVLNEALMHGTLPKTSEAPRIVLAFSYAPRFVADYDEAPGAAMGADFHP